MLDLPGEVEGHTAGGEGREQLGHVIGADGLRFHPFTHELVGVRPDPLLALPHHPQDADPLQPRPRLVQAGELGPVAIRLLAVEGETDHLWMCVPTAADR